MKKRYKIHEVAKRLGVSASLIRYYEEKGLISIEKDPENGYRLFSDADIFKLWLITFHRSIHMDLGEIGFLMHGYTLDETKNSVAEHRKKTVALLEQAKRDLEICDFYDRYIDRARREGEPPLVVADRTFYLYLPEDIFRRQKPSFPACTLGCRFENGEETQYSAVYEEDMFMLSSEERARYQEKLILKDMLSVVVSVDGSSFGSAALKKAVLVAEQAGYEICEPCYTFFQLSLSKKNDLGYSYEVFLTIKKGS